MIKYDVIIVGAGIAGLYAAMNLPKEKKILIINKRETFKCNSFYTLVGCPIFYVPLLIEDS